MEGRELSFLPEDRQPGINIAKGQATPFGGAAKRMFDFVFALFAIVSFLPFFVMVFVVIRISSPGHALFVHNRVGYEGRVFPCLKFRTMVPNAEQRLTELLESDPLLREEFSRTRKLRRDPRIIPGIGKLLRCTSLDELPQFFNVLAGHMSIVGPRPLTKEELRDYEEDAPEYIRARPGITGLWQISGRSNTTFHQRRKLDCRYLERWSFWEDLRIIFKTALVLKNGAY